MRFSLARAAKASTTWRRTAAARAPPQPDVDVGRETAAEVTSSRPEDCAGRMIQPAMSPGWAAGWWHGYWGVLGPANADQPAAQGPLRSHVAAVADLGSELVRADAPSVMRWCREGLDTSRMLSRAVPFGPSSPQGWRHRRSGARSRGPDRSGGRSCRHRRLVCARCGGRCAGSGASHPIASCGAASLAPGRPGGGSNGGCGQRR